MDILSWVQKFDLELIAAILGGLIVWLMTWAIPKTVAEWRASSSRYHSVIGDWDSWWGPTTDDVKQNHEIITIKRHYASGRVRGIARRDSEPGKEWELEGRFDGHYLQMYYYPSKRSRKPNYADFGCYFFIPEGKGSMVGLSSGKGPDETTGIDTLTAEYCLIQKLET